VTERLLKLTCMRYHPAATCRYDLTVPFARYVALNGIGQIKRYHIGKVYRRDNPAMARGRFREFYQCDFDIAGSHSGMVADAEVVKVLDEILSELDIGNYVIKLNDRRLLDAIMEVSGVPASKFRPICSAIDKLDKAEWGEVRREMIEDKGLSEPVADLVGEFVSLRGAPGEMLQKLNALPKLTAHAGAVAALADLKVFFELLKAMRGLEKVSFDLSLARGLDYYTGVIYEAVLMSGKKDESGQEVHVGSVAAGGRSVLFPCVGAPRLHTRSAAAAFFADCLRRSSSGSRLQQNALALKILGNTCRVMNATGTAFSEDMPGHFNQLHECWPPPVVISSSLDMHVGMMIYSACM
jgi:hypothetical protein